jgi:phosphoribosylformylglycinamidine (FGAM) synthase-like amidotransferase family enzyme
MAGSVMPIAVAHGEGRVLHSNVEALNNSGLVALVLLMPQVQQHKPIP